jgi:1-aminocyclopropane-1-carboxylate deaminase
MALHGHSQIERIERVPRVGTVSVLRLDLPDPIEGGNKRFKLKYNIREFLGSGSKQLITFGGAYSNHIAAVAAAARNNRINTIGIIRGEELNSSSNAVLRFASDCGMRLIFVSRDEYRRRNDSDYHSELRLRFPESFIIPEGGTNAAAVRGCTEILSKQTEFAKHIFLPVGTGGTISGIIRSLHSDQKVHGISVVGEGEVLNPVIASLSGQQEGANWELHTQFTFGGYGQQTPELAEFIMTIKNKSELPLDFVYSGKAFFGMMQLIEDRGYNPEECLFVHTGGYAFMNTVSEG